MASKSVKIDLQTFIKLMRYFTLDEHTEELYEEIKRDIDSKADKLYRHELYSQSSIITGKPTLACIVSHPFLIAL